jgi:hypothetical protein
MAGKMTSKEVKQMFSAPKKQEKDKAIERMFDELTPDEQKKIEAIKTVDDIKSVELLDTWEDDHEMCAGVEINGVKMGFWWIGSGIGAFEYPDSPKAKKDVLEMIKEAVQDAYEDTDESKKIDTAVNQLLNQ